MAGENEGNANPGGGGNPGGKGGTGNPGDSGTDNPNAGNKDEITTPLHTGIWDTPESKPAAPVTPAAAPAPGTQKTPDELMTEHIAGLGLGAGLNVEGLTEALNSGDTKPLVAMIEASAANAYKAAIESTGKLMETKIAAAVDKAVSTAEGNVNSGLALKEMHIALPFTNAPDLSPVADAVMTRLIGNGKSVTEAIAGTKGFFKAITEQGLDHFSDDFDSRPGSGNLNRPTNQTDDYWADLFKGIAGDGAS